MSVVSDVRVEDMGHKMGCNGVDNGKLWFDGMLLTRAYPSCSPFRFSQDSDLVRAMPPSL